MASADPFAESGKSAELDGAEDDDRFGDSTGVAKKPFTTGLRGRVGSLAPSMPSFLDTSKQSPMILNSFLVVGLLLAFTTICILGVICTRMSARKPYPNLCLSVDCLEEAATVLDFVNKSVDPCDNFYNYACGNFKTIYPADGFWDAKDAWTMLDDFNDASIESALAAPIRNKGSAEAKGKQFYSDCTDEYLKTDMGGKPLVAAINNLGGWYALNSYNSKQWASAGIVNSALMNAHAIYAVAPFFTIDVAPDYDHKPSGHPPEKYTIEFNIASLGLGAYDYLSPTSHSSQYRMQAYQTFMKTVIQLLWKDSGITPPQPSVMLAKFTSDVIEIETAIANITYSTGPSWGQDVYKPISYLVNTYPGLINWLSLLQYYFPNAANKITAATMVRLHEEDYMGLISNYLSSVFNDKKDPLNPGTRKLNNYIMWTIARQYAPDLGWEYVHANRDYSYAKYNGYVTFVGQQKWCVIQMDRNLQYLLSGLYIADFFQSGAQTKAGDVFDYLERTLNARVDGYSWMDASARAEAKKKLTQLKKKIGYPDWLGDVDKINNYFSKLVITAGSSFSNIVQVTAFSRTEDEALLGTGVDPGAWPTSIYKADVTLQFSYNALYVPAGFLQHPMFDGKIPQYMNFASMGRFAGGLMTADIDYQGSYYDENGYSATWYPKSTMDNFNSKIKDCQGNLFLNQTWSVGGYNYTITPTDHPFTMARVSYRDVAALNVAYNAYRSYITDKGPELGLPGFQSESIDQAFFTAFAQTWCQSADPLYTWISYDWWYSPIPEMLVNTVMQQMPQFRTAFQCPKTQRMGVPLSCTTF